MNEDLQAQLFEKLGTLSAKMDVVIQGNESLGRRVRVLENYKTKLIGVAAGISLVATIAIEWVKGHK
jgi:hypothetical protein